MDDFLLALVLAVNAAAVVAGVVLGIWASKHVPPTLQLSGAPPALLRFSMLAARVFVFLICLLAVTTPFAFLGGIILD